MNSNIFFLDNEVVLPLWGLSAATVPCFGFAVGGRPRARFGRRAQTNF